MVRVGSRGWGPGHCPVGLKVCVEGKGEEACLASPPSLAFWVLPPDSLLVACSPPTATACGCGKWDWRS